MQHDSPQFSAGTFKYRTSPLSFPVFMETFKSKLKDLFHENSEVDKLSILRGLPPTVLQEIMAHDPLAVAIPLEHGGRGGDVSSILELLSAASYESLALSLTFGINTALFIQPLAKYGDESIKQSIFKRFLNDRSMGGLMITEPGHGSDALGMQTAYDQRGGHFHIQGTKHWAGLTGMADFWLLTARRRTEKGDLMRDIDFFICDAKKSGQKIIVEEYFENLGLYQIPYGRNRIDVKVPEIQRLEPHSSGIQMMLDLLHRSRIQFPGMGLGFIKRMLDEAILHCRKRLVGSKSLLHYDQVQARLARLQASFTICSALCTESSEIAGLSNDLAPSGFEANVIKTITTDMMQEASQSLLQLVGAKGYRLNHIAGRSIVDSRPFQIFEGSNDILYQQISETVLKLMRNMKESSLANFLRGYTHTFRAAERLKEILNFEVNMQMPQRKLVELGRALSRIASMELVLKLGDKGFRNDLVENAIRTLEQEISGIIYNYKIGYNTLLVENYEEHSSWLQMAR
jgi:alkylation response protein AidB-like acyl-CoA dehydrogenase